MIDITKKVLLLLDEKQKKKIIAIVLMMLVGAAMESLGVSLIYPLVTAITNENEWDNEWYAKIICKIFNINNQRTYIETLLIMLLIVFLIKNVYLMFERYIQNGFVAKNRFKMQKQLMTKYMNKPYEYFLESNSGEIIRIITSDTMQVFNLLTNIIVIFTEGFVCVVIGITLLIMNPLISSCLIVLLLVEVFVLTRIVRPIMVDIGRKNVKYSAKANEWMIEAINGIKSIKVSNTSQFFIDMYSKSAIKTIDSQRKSETINTIPKVVIETITMEVVLVMILIMIVNGCELNSLVPILSSFAIAALRLLPCMSTITSAINITRYAEPSLDKILDIINEKNEKDIRVYNNQSKIVFNKSIELERITFGYRGSNKKILNDATMKIKLGQSIGIIGASGAGKTTTVDIMLGLLRPTSGCVIVDGINIENNVDSWLSNLAYIPQQIFLMDDTIRANVAFGINKENVNDDKVWEALKDAQLDDFVKELPEGLDSKVGERGTRLSGGQCQRIGIARALYNNPKLLVFDEATSSLDNETEKAIMQSINSLKGKKTMIIIAHRLTTIENCDRVFKIEKGKIIEK